MWSSLSDHTGDDKTQPIDSSLIERLANPAAIVMEETAMHLRYTSQKVSPFVRIFGFISCYKARYLSLFLSLHLKALALSLSLSLFLFLFPLASTLTP